MTKRSLAALLALLLLVLIAGCGKNAAESSNKPDSNANTNSDKAATNPSATPSTSTPDANTAPAPTKGGAVATGGDVPTGQLATAKGCQKANVENLKKGDTAKICALQVTVNEVSVISKGPPQGYIYLLVRVTIRNDADGDYTINTSDHFRLETPEGKNANLNIQATTQKSPRLQGTLGKGQEISGWLGYMPKQAKGDFKFTFVHPDFGEATWIITQ